jgi:hypothetical protein
MAGSVFPLLYLRNGSGAGLHAKGMQGYVLFYNIFLTSNLTFRHSASTCKKDDNMTLYDELSGGDLYAAKRY